MNTVAILLCGGSGNRMRGEVVDKVLVNLAGRPVVDHSLLAFEQLKEISAYWVVYRDKPQKIQLETRLAILTSKPVSWTRGGNERQDSVFNALEAIPAGTQNLMIHDCARPLIEPEALRAVYRAMVEDKAAVLAHRVVDTIKQVSARTRTNRKVRLKDLDRQRLWAMETPQAFDFSLIHAAYRKLRQENLQVTDDTAAVSQYGQKVTLVENPFPNPKITRPEDLILAELMLQQRREKS